VKNDVIKNSGKKNLSKYILKIYLFRFLDKMKIIIFNKNIEVSICQKTKIA
jgi:hypothetical protein